MSRRSFLWVLATSCCVVLAAESSECLTTAPPADPVVEGLGRLDVASIADAVDQVTGRRGFMSPDMRPILENKKIAGRAITARLVPIMKHSDDASGVSHSVQAIEQAKPGEILCILVEDGVGIAGIGGLMATTCVVRELGGAVIDGGMRDVQEMQALGFQCYGRGITPASSIGRYTSVSMNAPIRCGGVDVRKGDIIVGDFDGICVVPAEVAEQVLKTARGYEEKEKNMVPLIKEHKSLLKAIEAYGRI